MIIIEEIMVGDIPCLEIVEESAKFNELPLVMFYHGFESTKERNIQYAYLLAKQGNRVVLPEAIHHGVRKPLTTKKELEYVFWPIVFQTIEEVALIKKYYEEKSYILENKIFIAGSSMGAMIVYGALVKYPWIKGAASFMGMPAFEMFARYQTKDFSEEILSLDVKEKLLKTCTSYDITQQIDKLNNRPLFIWHGREDKTVPVNPVVQFYLVIKKVYNEEEGKLKFIIDEKAGHFVPNAAVYAFIRWMDEVCQ